MCSLLSATSPVPSKRSSVTDLATEHGTFDKKTRRYHVEVTPTTGADKSTIRADLWVEKIGEKKIRRCAKVSVEVRIMIVGKLIEERVVNDMTLSYSKAAEFTNTWVKKKGL